MAGADPLGSVVIKKMLKGFSVRVLNQLAAAEGMKLTR